MQSDLKDEIRARAYAIWEQEGQSGSPEDHWLRAEQELRAISSDSDTPGATKEDKILDQLGDFA